MLDACCIHHCMKPLNQPHSAQPNPFMPADRVHIGDLVVPFSASRHKAPTNARMGGRSNRLSPISSSTHNNLSLHLSSCNSARQIMPIPRFPRFCCVSCCCFCVVVVVAVVDLSVVAVATKPPRETQIHCLKTPRLLQGHLPQIR